MEKTPVSISRRQVLGDLYIRCETIQTVPVFLGDPNGVQIGFADQSLGHYADAFSFFLEDAYTKKLSSGHFRFGLGYEYIEAEVPKRTQKIRLNFICLSPLRPDPAPST